MNSRNNEMEIDLLELFRVWKKKLWGLLVNPSSSNVRALLASRSACVRGRLPEVVV